VNCRRPTAGSAYEYRNFSRTWRGETWLGTDGTHAQRPVRPVRPISHQHHTGNITRRSRRGRYIFYRQQKNHRISRFSLSRHKNRTTGHRTKQAPRTKCLYTHHTPPPGCSADYSPAVNRLWIFGLNGAIWISF